jgi:hypothetical protein
MNDLASLLQQVNDMNASWLQVAVTAQSAFDTIDAAALKTQQTLKDTMADVNGLNKSLGGIKGNISVSVNNDQITATQNQIKQLQSQAGPIGKPASGNGINAATNTESSSFADKAITAATKSIVKGGITSVIEDKALGTAVKEELANGFRGLVADEAGEFVASSAGGILGDVLGGGIAGGLEVALGAVAPEIIIPVVAAGALIKSYIDQKNKKHKPVSPAEYEYEFTPRPIQQTVGYAKDVKRRVPLEKHKFKEGTLLVSYLPSPATTSDTVFTGPEILKPTSERKPPEPPILEGIYRDKFESIAKNYKKYGYKYVAARVDQIREDVQKADQVYRTMHPSAKTSPFMAAFKKGTRQLDAYMDEVDGVRPRQVAKRQIAGRPERYVMGAKNENTGKVINININKAFVENFSIHAQNVQQGYDNLKQKVEEIFLEILNSANAVHE